MSHTQGRRGSGVKRAQRAVHRDDRRAVERMLHATCSCNGHSGSPNVFPISLAEWAHGTAVGSIQRECLDHVVIFNERHLRHVLLAYVQL
jgi:hypothetical protein